MATILGPDIECLARKCHTTSSLPLKAATTNLLHFRLNKALVQSRASCTLLTAAEQAISHGRLNKSFPHMVNKSAKYSNFCWSCDLPTMC